MKKQLLGSLLMLIAAAVWGFAFAFQSMAMDHIGAFFYSALRFMLGGLVLTPFLFVRDKAPVIQNETDLTDENNKTVKKGYSFFAKHKTLLIGGLICGLFLTIAANLQQLGIDQLNGVNVGKAGFLTVLYIVIVPIFGLFLHKKCPLIIWCVLPIALVGLFLLCGGISKDGFKFGLDDILLISCAFFYSFHIMAIDHFAPKVNPIKLSCLQFWVCGLVTLIIALSVETVTWEQIYLALPGILFGGIGSCGIAFTLQTVSQKFISPAVASLCMSFESTFSALGGWLLQHTPLSTNELIGCACMFVVIMAVNLEPFVKAAIQKKRAHSNV